MLINNERFEVSFKEIDILILREEKIKIVEFVVLC